MILVSTYIPVFKQEIIVNVSHFIQYVSRWDSFSVVYEQDTVIGFHCQGHAGFDDL